MKQNKTILQFVVIVCLFLFGLTGKIFAVNHYKGESAKETTTVVDYSFCYENKEHKCRGPTIRKIVADNELAFYLAVAPIMFIGVCISTYKKDNYIIKNIFNRRGNGFYEIKA